MAAIEMAASGWKRPSILKAFKTNKRRNTNFSVSLERHNTIASSQRVESEELLDDGAGMDDDAGMDTDYTADERYNT